MDSKSISRKGVGVQVPASAPLAQPPDELARALVPVLLHKLNNTTQYLGALHALLADKTLDTARERALDGLAQTALEVDDLGWILGLIANASGADVLLERRERSRFGALVRMVADCLRRERRDLAAPDRALPEFDVRSAQDAWRIPWATARWLHCAGRSLPAGGLLEWELVDRAALRPTLVCRVSATSPMEALGGELRALDARLDCDFQDGTSALLLPVGTFGRQGSAP